VATGRGRGGDAAILMATASPADHVSVCLRRRRFVEGSAPKYKHAGSG